MQHDFFDGKATEVRTFKDVTSPYECKLTVISYLERTVGRIRSIRGYGMFHGMNINVIFISLEALTVCILMITLY